MADALLSQGKLHSSWRSLGRAPFPVWVSSFYLRLLCLLSSECLLSFELSLKAILWCAEQRHLVCLVLLQGTHNMAWACSGLFRIAWGSSHRHYCGQRFPRRHFSLYLCKTGIFRMKCSKKPVDQWAPQSEKGNQWVSTLGPCFSLGTLWSLPVAT